MTRHLVARATVFLGCLGLGCGDSDDGEAAETVSCNFVTTVGGSSAMGVCFEWSGITADQVDVVRQTCPATASPGDTGVTTTSTFSSGPCSTEDVLGGCRILENPYLFTTWYYPDSEGSRSIEDVRETCMVSNGVFIPAP